MKDIYIFFTLWYEKLHYNVQWLDTVFKQMQHQNFLEYGLLLTIDEKKKLCDTHFLLQMEDYEEIL